MASRGMAALCALAVAACAPLGVVGDGSTVSGGQVNRGWLLDGRRLPDRGPGFVVHQIWRTRGLRYGTDELVALLTQAAGAIAPENAPVRLGVGDLSRPGGGPAAPHHRSHQSGRDVDLLLYLRDAQGKAYETQAMISLGDDGVARDGSGHSLDAPRTWRLVKALLTSPAANVQYIFLYEPLTQLLLDHARGLDEPAWLVELARLALVEPSGAPHDDHLHVRLYCAPTDAVHGCTDFGDLTLLAKGEKRDAAQRVVVRFTALVREVLRLAILRSPPPFVGRASSAPGGSLGGAGP